MTTQTVGDLRVLITRRAGTSRRVALLASDNGLVAGLEGNGCVVLEDPGSLEALTQFAPDVVVAFDGFLQNGASDSLRALAAAAPKAELLLSFSNAASATATLSALCDTTPAPGLTERDVTRWLSGVGYRVKARDFVIAPRRETGLAADTEANVRLLLEQLNPNAVVDRFLLVAVRGEAVAEAPRTSDLVCVVVAATANDDALRVSLASLSRQHQRPLELIVVGSAASLEVAQRLPQAAQVTVRAVPSDAAEVSARWNAGLAHATGQYVTFWVAGETAEPPHLMSLVKAVASGTSAWALARFDETLPRRFSLSAWLRRGATAPATWLIDRARVGSFGLTFAAGVDGAEAMLFARLAALFTPAVAEGPRLVDVQHAPKAALGALTAGRPLPVLSTLPAVLRDTEPAPLGTAVRDALEQNPRTRDGLKQLEGLARRLGLDPKR